MLCVTIDWSRGIYDDIHDDDQFNFMMNDEWWCLVCGGGASTQSTVYMYWDQGEERGIMGLEIRLINSLIIVFWKILQGELYFVTKVINFPKLFLQNIVK